MLEYLRTVRERPVWRPVPADVRKRLSGAPPPRSPADPADVYEEFKRDVLPYPTGNIHPRFWGWVIGTGTPLGMLADMLASGMNPQVAEFDDSSAVVENQVHATARLAVVLPADMESREKQLYRQAKGLMPRLPFDDIDLLIVDRIGKNISGAGMDPNVIGRSLHGYCALLSDRSTKPAIRRIFVRDLTPETHGNGVGVGLADFTTSRLVRAIDQRVTFLNALTALSLQSVKVPIHFETDREAITRALESLALPDSTRARVVRIQDTLSVEKMEVSEALIEEARTRADLELLTTSGEMSFDPADNLAPMK